VLAVAGCGNRGSKANAGQRVKVTQGTLLQVVQASGNVEPLNKVSILPPITGRIDKILVDEGAYVKKGQILAWMSASDRAALLDAARSQGADSVKYWEDAYKATPIVAPSSGLIIARNIVEGQTVSSDTDLYDLSDRLIVLAYVDETDLGKIHMRQPADVTVEAYPDSAFKCAVSLIGHQSIKVNNVISYQVNLEPQKVPGELRAGMTANISFIVQQKDDVLLLPNFAVKGQTNSTVDLKVVVDPKKPPEDRTVQLGGSDGVRVEVVSGLDEGDTVLVSSLDLPKAASGGPLSMTGSQQKGQGGGSGTGRRQ
jgi:membrane fusion protein, macrolide-specific efflux system